MPMLLALYALFVIALTIAEYRQDSRAQYFFKPAAALGFLLLAVMSGALESLYGQIILAGLLACALGDILLLKRGNEKVFILGMAAFALGHIIFAHGFYLVHLHNAAEPPGSFISIAVTGAVLLMVCGFSVFEICKHAAPKMRAPVALYTLVIWAMLVFAVLSRAPNLILGAALFAVSDIFVARDRFVERKPWYALSITPLYFGAQALFALSTANAL